MYLTVNVFQQVRPILLHLDQVMSPFFPAVRLVYCESVEITITLCYSPQ